MMWNALQKWSSQVSLSALKAKMLFITIFTGWHFLGQLEASCSCFSCTMPYIHCIPNHCPLVPTVNSCWPMHGLFMASGNRLSFSLAGGNFNIININYYKKQSTIIRLKLSATPLSFSINPTRHLFWSWHWATMFIRTTDSIPKDN